MGAPPQQESVTRCRVVRGAEVLGSFWCKSASGPSSPGCAVAPHKPDAGASVGRDGKVMAGGGETGLSLSWPPPPGLVTHALCPVWTGVSHPQPTDAERGGECNIFQTSLVSLALLVCHSFPQGHCQTQSGGPYKNVSCRVWGPSTVTVLTRLSSCVLGPGVVLGGPPRPPAGQAGLEARGLLLWLPWRRCS